MSFGLPEALRSLAAWLLEEQVQEPWMVPVEVPSIEKRIEQLN